jgi:uroporphyrinogen decarboxylase
MMNPKENALRIVRFDNPERVVSNVPSHGLGYLGVNHEAYDGSGHHLPVGSTWTDIWGTGWRKEHEGVMGFMQAYPLADLPRALKTYSWPDPDDERICAPIYEGVKGWNPDEAFLGGSHRCTLWERTYKLVGMEDHMCYFHTEPGAVRELLHGVMDFQLGIARHYVEVGVETIGMSDDLGTQSGLLLSPEIVHEFLVPEYRRLFDFYKAHGVMIGFHSCGHVVPLLEMFMELGVDVLNPVQSTANDLDEVRRITQGRMALHGGVSTATLMDGPPEAIREEVKRRMWQLGRTGGYFCAPDQGMPWPEAHIAALRDTVAECGAYPLCEA